MRLLDSLVDDVYRIDVVGAGEPPPRFHGAAFNNGVNYSLDFRLDLGQADHRPSSRNRCSRHERHARDDDAGPHQSGGFCLFAEQDRRLLQRRRPGGRQASGQAEDPQFYRLFISRNTLDPADDQVVMPTNVEYSPATDSASCSPSARSPRSNSSAAATARAYPVKSFRLRIGTTESAA